MKNHFVRRLEQFLFAGFTATFLAVVFLLVVDRAMNGEGFVPELLTITVLFGMAWGGFMLFAWLFSPEKEAQDLGRDDH